MQICQVKENPQKTKALKTELFVALQTIDLEKVEEVLQAYGLIDQEVVKEFLESLNPIFETWKEPGQGSTLKDEVTTGNSRCIGCEFGKDVTRFTFKFQHKEAAGIKKQIIYARSFGVRFETENKCFSGISVCNAFLSEEEMKVLDGNAVTNKNL